jgi:trigger factor
MNIERKNIDAVNATLKLQIGKEDYQDAVNKMLRKYKKTANVKGFRPGNAPDGLIKKMYGKAAMADVIDRLISEEMTKYIQDNKIKLLGEPLPNREEQDLIDFDTQEEFVFNFDIALEPEFDVVLDSNFKAPYHEITLTDEMIDNTVKSYAGRFGSHVEADAIEEGDVVKGELVEMRTKTKPKEDGIVVEEAVLCPKYMKDDEQKALFNGVKVGGHLTFNPRKAYDGNDAEIASLLRKTKEEVAEVSSDFKFTIKGITRYKEAEINQELFDKALGEGAVKSETEFRDRIADDLKKTFEQDSDYKLLLDAKKIMLKNIEGVAFPDDFLKRWVMSTNKEMKQETLDEQYPAMLEDLKWHIIKRKIAESTGLKIENGDLEAYAKKIAQAQFAQYGMTSVPDDVLENYTKEMMQKREYLDRMIDQVMDEKVMKKVKESVSLDKKSVTMEEFNKLFSEGQ